MAPRLKHWLPVIFWLAVIFSMSTDTFSSQNTSVIIEPMLRFLKPTMTLETIEMVHGFIRKCAHITEYFILGLLLFRAFHYGTLDSSPSISALLAVIFVVIAASADEFHQSFVATRTASIADVLLDATGGILAQFMRLFWRRWKHT
ncbi:MAG TPA: VanZ family protein [Thermodesulfovibrionales bacterium]|jgi:VanZ family protein|nr:VanZ family protein [Thermodesulfovibrionales bacterium]